MTRPPIARGIEPIIESDKAAAPTLTDRACPLVIVEAVGSAALSIQVLLDHLSAATSIAWLFLGEAASALGHLATAVDLVPLKRPRLGEELSSGTVWLIDDPSEVIRTPNAWTRQPAPAQSARRLAVAGGDEQSASACSSFSRSRRSARRQRAGTAGHRGRWLARLRNERLAFIHRRTYAAGNAGCRVRLLVRGPTIWRREGSHGISTICTQQRRAAPIPFFQRTERGGRASS